MSSSVEIRDYETACRFLLELKKRGVSLELTRMKRLLERLGNPHRQSPCVHIAGTNGKGSVAAMLEAILRRAGWRTGLYTSPHLVRLSERIQVDRHELPEGALISYAREMQQVLHKMSRVEGEANLPTYFEVMTAMAFLHFRRSQCDIACIEVGLGGKNDATNVVTPEVSVVTSIGLDHMEVLGSTIEAIAAEKAGIIKQGRPLVIGRVPSAAEIVLRDVALRMSAPVHSVLQEFGDALERYPSTSLGGAFQRLNAATAALAARTLSPKWRIPEAVIKHGLKEVGWPARWQRFQVGGRTLILDSSHNAEGAQALEINLISAQREFGRAPLVVVGVLGATRAKPLLDVICRHSAEIRLVQPKQSRACTHQELEELLPITFRGKTVRDTVPNLFPGGPKCNLGDVGDVVVVTGSIYLAGEVLWRIDPAAGSYEGHLQDF